MKATLYQYAILYHPAPPKGEPSKPSEVIVPVTSVAAETDQAVVMQAARQIPQEYADKLDRVEIAVRPF